MKLIFGRGPSLSLRLFFAVILSVSLMLADNRLDGFATIRSYLNNLVAPMQYAANLPRQMFDGIYRHLDSHQSLVQKNKDLEHEIIALKAELLVLDDYKNTNERLRKLLKSPSIRDETKMIAEVMSVDSSIYRKRVLINKGSTDGVFEGQPVINESGIVGQVINVSLFHSHVLLLTDVDSAIPVQVLRNDIRLIASGGDQTQMLHLENISNGTDIQVNDVLVTSGLGGIYPEGYPVGIVNETDSDHNASFSNVSVTPSVDFDRLRYLLLVWTNDQYQNEEQPIQEPHAENAEGASGATALLGGDLQENGLQESAQQESEQEKEQENERESEQDQPSQEATSEEQTEGARDE